MPCFGFRFFNRSLQTSGLLHGRQPQAPSECPLRPAGPALPGSGYGRERGSGCWASPGLGTACARSPLPLPAAKSRSPHGAEAAAKQNLPPTLLRKIFFFFFNHFKDICGLVITSPFCAPFPPLEYTGHGVYGATCA